MAGLNFDITGDNSNFLRKLEEARNGITSTSKQIEKEGTSIEAMFGRMAKGAAALGAGFSAQQFASQIMRVRGEFQQLEVAFKTMLGSKEKADALMSQLVKTAATTPFDLQSVAGGAKQLLAYGTAAEDVNGTLVQLGDIAAGLSIPLNDLVWLYGTTMTQGRLFTNDFRQFQSRGIPLADELAKQFGVTKDKVGELVTAGKVGFPEVQKAIVAMTSDGGKFGGLMEAQSKTITGQISNIEDSISTMYNNIGKSSEGFINDALSGASYLIENYETIGKTILELAATYGAYKAVLMSVAAYQSFAVGVTYTAEIAELSKLIPLKKQSANEDIVAAVASGKLTQSKAEQVIALRAEVAAKLQSLQATKVQAQAEFSSALATYKASRLRYTVAQEQVALAQSQMSIAIKSGTVEEIAAAKKNAQTVSLELNNAAVAKNTAHKSLNIAATNSKSASEALNTLETGKNSVAQVVNTTSTNVLTAAKTKLAAASKALGLSMLANPYVLAAAAVVGLGYGIYKLITHQSDAEKAQLKLNDAVKECEKNSLSEQRELAKLKGELSALTKGTDEYNATKEKIVKNFGKYNENLGSEIEKIGLTEQAYNKLTEAINRSFGARQYEKFATEQQDELSDTMAENLGNIQDRLLSELGNDYGSKIYAKIRNGVMRGSLSLGKKTFDIEGLDSETKAALDKISGVADNDIFRNKDIEKHIQNIILANKATDELNLKMRERLGIDDNPVNTEDKGTDDTAKAEQKAGRDWLKDKKDVYDQAIKDLEAYENSKKELTKEEYEKGFKEKKEKVEIAKKSYENAGGKISSQESKQESSADKLRQEQEKYNLLLDKQSREQKRMEEDSANELKQLEIDRLKEGSEKVLEQRKLNHEKELGAIKREAQDKKAKAIEEGRASHESNPDNKEKPFNAEEFIKSEPAKKQFATFDKTAEVKTKTENTKYNRGDDLSGLLNEYQDYTDKRLAIETKYNNDLAILEEQRKQAVKNSDTQQVDQIDRAKAQATKNKGKELIDMDYDKLKESPEYVRAFENLKETSSETLNSLLSQLENAKGAAAQVLSPDQLREYTTTIQEIMDELDSRNPFQALVDRKKELADAENELAEAKRNLDKVNSGEKVASGTKFNEKTGKIDTTYLTSTQALEKYNKAKDKSVKADAKVKKSELLTPPPK